MSDLPEIQPANGPGNCAEPTRADFTHTFSVSKIVLALSKAQGAMEPASKDRVNPHFKSKYADLAAVMDAARKPLADNELAIIQPVTTPSGGGVKVTTMLMHSSGEWMRSDCTFPVGQHTAQGIGSAITYARRYCAMAMLGIAPDEDDDGNAASAAPFHEPPAKGSRTASLKDRLAARTAKEESHPVDSPADEAPGPEVPVVPFGKRQGTPVAELDDESITWYADKARESLAKNDYKKLEWRAKDERWLAILQKDMERRKQ